jgi:hypothetical protein
MSENLRNKLLAWKPNKKTGVTSVRLARSGFHTTIKGRDTYFSNPYEAFFWGVQFGKRYEC